MWRAWTTVNLALIWLSVWTGYSEMEPERLSHANPDVVFCTLAFVTMILLSFGSVWYFLRRTKGALLRRPSWRRFSIDWWRDPLQCLCFMCSFMGAGALGAAFRLPGTSQTGFWMFMFFVSMFFGLLIGQFAVYAVYRENIQQT
jgi:hypothetical protein